MPPEAQHCDPLVTAVNRFTLPISPKGTHRHAASSYKFHVGSKMMKLTARKLIPALIFILSSISILRVLRIIASTSTSSASQTALPPAPDHQCSLSSPACGQVHSDIQHASGSNTRDFGNASALTEKEIKFLKQIISHRAPCNLLIFGLESQYLTLPAVNNGGTTVFLEDNPEKIRAAEKASNNYRIYKLEHLKPAKDAYKLLKHARKSPACAPKSLPLQASKCQLAIRGLPQEVYETKWNVIVIDGPTGNTLDAPGRMAAIYTAAILARSGNMTNVVVHDIDRMIEKWFSWEFLCEENLVSSKGKLWNFKITGQNKSRAFCFKRYVEA